MSTHELASFSSIRKLIVGLIVGFAALAGVSANATFFERESDEALFVFTDKGWIKGVETPGMNKFLGIPYAAPPVGALRWKAPQPAAKWQGVRDATTFGNHCPQVAGPFGLGSTTEDCLFLNVYTPNHEHGRFGRDDDDHDRFGHHEDEHGHPVMLWVHGGALVVGESDDYDPTPLVTRGDVIVVTINYRLGILGYLAHPALTAESAGSGNWGMLDQQAALQWVQRNIRRFGGNPNNVTVFGESAGGLSTQTQLASPLAAGLFDRAIVESGAYSINTQSLTTASALGTGFAGRKSCPGADATTAACLRALSVATILLPDAATRAISAPTVDGKVLTQTIRSAFTSGQFNQVPIMQGSNHDEFNLFVGLNFELVGILPSAANYAVLVGATVGGPIAAAALPHYPLANFGNNASVALGALGTDFTFDCPARTSAQLQSAFVPVFAYAFNDPNAPQLFLPPISIPYKAAHASEIQYLFNLRVNPGLTPAPFDADQQRLSNNMVSYWTHFARHGNPNSFFTPRWPAYDTTADQFQSLEPPRPMTISTFSTDHQCAFWTTQGR